MTNERPAICAACGDCCRTRPGLEDPARFLAVPDPRGALAAAVASGEWVLVRVAGVRCARPATVAERASGRVHEGPEPSDCVFLGESGCRLAFAARPRMCRELEPWASGDCVAGWEAPDAARAWATCQGLVDAAVPPLPRSG